MIWKSTSVFCKCLDEPSEELKLFALAKQFGGVCQDQCDDQLCGTATKLGESVAAFVNEFYPLFVNEDCDQILLKSNQPVAKEVITLRSLEQVSKTPVSQSPEN